MFNMLISVSLLSLYEQPLPLNLSLFFPPFWPGAMTCLVESVDSTILELTGLQCRMNLIKCLLRFSGGN